MADKKTLYMKVSNRIVAELPRFFGSFEAAIGEMFQNAYRAEAKAVIMSYSESQHVLVVSDNGPGCEPDRLLTAGETGWDNPKVAQDPAGVGAFSLLRPEYVESVTYESHGKHNWTMTLDQESLNGAPVVVTALADNLAKRGMTITLKLNPNLKVSKEMVQRAKGYYPFDLVWMEDDTGAMEKIEPLKRWESVLNLELPGAGKVEALFIDKTTLYGQSSEKTAIWQCIPIHSTALTNALHQACEKMPSPKLAAELVPLKIRFFVNHECGLRAKLPDRNELLDDAHLAAAALAIVQAVYDRCTTAISVAAKSWPSEASAHYERKFLPIGPDMDWLEEYLSYDNGAFARVMEFAGYQEVEYPLPDQANGYNMDEGDGDYLALEQHSKKYFARGKNIFRTDNSILVDSLNNQDIPTIFDDSKQTIVAITNLRVDGKNRWLAMADSIDVDGIGPVRFLIKLDGTDWAIPDLDNNPDLDEMVSIVFAGTPQDFIKEVNEQFWTGVIAIRCDSESELSDYEDYEYGEYSLDTRAILADLEAEAMRFLSGNLSEMRREKQLIIEACEEIEKGLGDVTYYLSTFAKITTSPVVSAAIRLRIEQAVNEAKAACSEARGEASNLDLQINMAIGGQPVAVPALVP